MVLVLVSTKLSCHLFFCHSGAVLPTYLISQMTRLGHYIFLSQASLVGPGKLSFQYTSIVDSPCFVKYSSRDNRAEAILWVPNGCENFTTRVRLLDWEHFICSVGPRVFSGFWNFRDSEIYRRRFISCLSLPFLAGFKSSFKSLGHILSLNAFKLGCIS